MEEMGWVGFGSVFSFRRETRVKSKFISIFCYIVQEMSDNPRNE